MANVQPFSPGKPGCPDLPVDRVTPIYVDPVLPTVPMLVSPPLPTIMTPVIPNDCVCLTFTGGVAEAKAKDTQKAKVAIEIAQSGADCCDGVYAVTPTIDVPCVPFTIKKGDLSISNIRSGEGSLSLDRNGCDLTPKLTLPCVPFSVGEGEVSIKKVALDDAKLKLTASNCVVTPKLTLPCMPFTINRGELEITSRDDDGEISLDTTDCSITPRISIPCIPFDVQDTASVTVTSNKTGRLKTLVSGCTLSHELEIPCMPFTVGSGRISVKEGKVAGGSITMSAEGCKLDTKIDITVPEAQCQMVPHLGSSGVYAYENGRKVYKGNVLQVKNGECSSTISLNLNMGCPVKDTTSKSTLNLGSAGSITATLSGGCEPSIALSGSLNIPEIPKIPEIPAIPSGFKFCHSTLVRETTKLKYFDLVLGRDVESQVVKAKNGPCYEIDIPDIDITTITRIFSSCSGLKMESCNTLNNRKGAGSASDSMPECPAAIGRNRALSLNTGPGLVLKGDEKDMSAKDKIKPLSGSYYLDGASCGQVCLFLDGDQYTNLRLTKGENGLLKLGVYYS